jgi:hypothetical protein
VEKKLSVKSKYIDEMNEFLEYAKKNSMRWSDLIVIIGESLRPRMSVKEA